METGQSNISTEDQAQGQPVEASEAQGIERLDAKYPITDLLTQENIDFLVDQQVLFNLMYLVKESPLGNLQAELIMLQILQACAREGSWPEKKLGKTVPQEVKGANDFGNMERGYAKLIEQGFLFLEEREGDYIVKPTEKLIEFLKERLAQYGPEAEGEEV